MTFEITQNPLVQLYNGQLIPQLGLGVYKVQQDVATQVVRTALDLGYRRIDTAALYDNEQEVGAAVRASGLEREEIFVTTKIWNDRHGYENALEAIDESLERLNIGYVDMMLIHWPNPKADKYVETWAALEKSLESGKVRGIGVSNFHPEHLDRLLAKAEVVPALNQVELHPGLGQAEIRAYDANKAIATEAWSPLARGLMSDADPITAAAEAHSKTPAQVILRWHIQLGNLVIPKSSNPVRLAENLNIFDFELTTDEMLAIDALENGERIGPDPREF
ncbi:MAG: aldo/keto reductase [Microbacteriaceae bacterium]